jgi:hypothetical protein
MIANTGNEAEFMPEQRLDVTEKLPLSITLITL